VAALASGNTNQAAQTLLSNAGGAATQATAAALTAAGGSNPAAAGQATAAAAARNVDATATVLSAAQAQAVAAGKTDQIVQVSVQAFAAGSASGNQAAVSQAWAEVRLAQALWQCGGCAACREQP
jgi:hypothetical protein